MRREVEHDPMMIDLIESGLLRRYSEGKLQKKLD